MPPKGGRGGGGRGSGGQGAGGSSGAGRGRGGAGGGGAGKPPPAPAAGKQAPPPLEPENTAGPSGAWASGSGAPAPAPPQESSAKAFPVETTNIIIFGPQTVGSYPLGTGWDFSAVVHYRIPSWVNETSTKLPDWMLYSDGTSTVDLDMDPYPGDFFPPNVYEISLTTDKTWGSSLDSAPAGRGSGGRGAGGTSGGPGGNVCFSWKNTGSCKFGDRCNFLHEGAGGEGGSVDDGMRRMNLGERPTGAPPQRGRGGDGGRGRGRGDSPGGRGRGRGANAEICRFFRSPQGCRFGDRCQNRHE